MIYLKSLIYNIIGYGTIAVGSLISTVLGPFVPQSWIIALWNDYLLIFSRWCLKVICGLEMELRGVENIQQGGAIFACKHESAVETYYLTTFLKKATYIFKKELAYIPLFGWAVYFYGSVPVDRAGGSAAMKKMLRESKKLLKAGRSIIIFPEGTRTKPGQTSAYKPGLAFLYQNTDAPVIPVATNTGLFWTKRSFLRHPGKIVFEFLPPMPRGLQKKEFMEELRSRIESKCAELNAEAVRNYPQARAIYEAAKENPK